MGLLAILVMLRYALYDKGLILCRWFTRDYNSIFTGSRCEELQSCRLLTCLRVIFVGMLIQFDVTGLHSLYSYRVKLAVQMAPSLSPAADPPIYCIVGYYGIISTVDTYFCCAYHAGIGNSGLKPLPWKDWNCCQHRWNAPI